MFLLKSLNPKDIEIINEESMSNEAEDENWNDTDISNIGKIGFNSKSFVEDKED